MTHTIEVYGNTYEAREDKRSKEGKPRFVINGITHPAGLPIRFKSLDRAKRHLMNIKS